MEFRRSSQFMSKIFALLISVTIVLLTAGCAVNPITGDEELMLFDEEQDIAMGRHFAPQVEKQMGGRIHDKELQEYVDRVGQRIGRVSQKPQLEYHFVALNHKSVNAFALPGGYLFITRGMLEKLESEAQLAAVLAHEIVHVVARDTANMMSNELGLNTLLVGTAAVVKPSRSVMTTAVITSKILELKYSREDERQADLAGMKYMVRAGYDPNGVVEVMQMLQEHGRNAPDEFMSSHPSSEHRVDYLKRRIRTRYSKFTGLKVGREDYQRRMLDRLPKRDI
jgi:predicted Zn-dependent protease